MAWDGSTATRQGETHAYLSQPSNRGFIEYPDLVVIYLGMRVNRLTGLKTLFGFGPKISDSVKAQPPGLLLHENFFFSFFPMHVGMRQYWRDMESLLAWTRSDPHRQWWKNFLRDSGGTGFWHETYLMRGGMEAIYDDVPEPIGFLRFAPVHTARGPMFGAAATGLGNERSGPRGKRERSIRAIGAVLNGFGNDGYSLIPEKPKEGAMTTAIGVVMTEHIVAGRLEDQRLTGKLLRYPDAADEFDALSAIPGSELVDILAEQIEALTANGVGPVDAIGVAVPGVTRHGVVEDSPNLVPDQGNASGRRSDQSAGLARHHGAGTHRQRRRRHRRRRSRHPRPTQQAHPRLDHRQWHRLRPLALCRRRVGGRPRDRNPRSRRSASADAAE